jgi:predicted transposase YdaD
MITNETFSLEKFVNQFEVISKLRNLGSILINKTENIMPLDISVEDLYSYQIGKQAGMQEGIKDGEQKGLRKAKDEMIVSMIKKAKLSLMEIADIADVSLPHVKNLANKINE